MGWFQTGLGRLLAAVALAAVGLGIVGGILAGRAVLLARASPWTRVGLTLPPSQQHDVGYGYTTVGLPDRGAAVLIHGYHYDHAQRSPRYHADAWMFRSAGAGGGGGGGGGDVNATRLFRRQEDGPALRFGAATATVPFSATGQVWIYGGDDGGTRFADAAAAADLLRKGKKPRRTTVGYQPGMFFGDLWAWHSDTRVWDLVYLPQHGADGSHSEVGPPPRTQPVMVALDADRVWIFGGLIASENGGGGGGSRKTMAANDEWIFDARSRTWVQLAPSEADGDGGDRPSPRFAAGFGAIRGPDGNAETVFVYGGNPGDSSGCFGDLWAYHVESRTWSPVRHTPGSGPPPPPRGFGGFGLTRRPTAVVSGGAYCTKSCKTLGDLWAGALTKDPTRGGWEVTWRRVHGEGAPVTPMHRMKQAFVEMEPDKFLLTGGESFKPYAYYNDLWLLDASDL